MPKERYVWADALNIIACISVVILHCTNGAVHNFTEFNFDFVRGAFTHSFFLWPVPVFYALSGCMLIGYDFTTIERVKQYAHRRVLRTLIPFFFWGGIYVLLPQIIKHESVSIASSIGSILAGPGVLWFFIPLFGLYLMYPFVNRMVVGASNKFILYFLVISFVFVSLVPFIGKMTGWEKLMHCNLFVVGSGSVMYAVMGYYIGKYTISPNYRKMIYGLSLTATIIQFVIILKRIPEAGFDDGIFTHTGTPTNVLTVLGVFTLFRYINWDRITEYVHISASTLSHVSACSFGIYLIHKLIITSFNMILPDFVAHTPFSFVLIYMLALCVISIARRLPVVKYVIP